MKSYKTKQDIKKEKKKEDIEHISENSWQKHKIKLNFFKLIEIRNWLKVQGSRPK